MKVRSQGPTKKRKGFVNDLNLVPFIDLFSLIIVFLIITSNFNEVASVKLKMGSEDAAEKTIKVPVKEVQANLKITIREKRIDLFNQGRVTRVEVPTDLEEVDFQAIEEFVANARQALPEKKDMVLFAGDKVEYGLLVKVMDLCLAEDFDELVVSGTNPGMGNI